MKNLFILSSLFIGILCIGCGGTQSVASSSQEMAAVDSLIQNKKFKVECQWAMPTMSSSMMKVANSGLMGPGNNVQRVDITGSANYLEVKGDSVKADLPFFGERQMGGGYNDDDEGIKFDQMVSNMDVIYMDSNKNKHYRIKFSANNNTESFNVTLTVYSNKKATLIINSSERDMMTYQGEISALSESQ